MVRVADLLMSILYQNGIGTLFTITGRGILYLSDALARNEQIRGVCVHHEQAASYAAYAYAQVKDSLGACLISTGCASTNTMTGVLCAWQDDVPCLFLSGQHMLEETTCYTGLPIRTYGSQEANIVELVKPITKYAVMITEAKEAAYEMEKAIYMAKEGRKGPVWVDVPLDIQNMRVEEDKIRHFVPEENPNGQVLSAQEKNRFCEMWNGASRPVMLLGSGVRSAGAADDLRQFAEKLQIPVVFAPSAADVYGAGERFSMGAVGSLGGSRVGNFVLQNADLVLVLGCRLTSMVTGSQFEKFAREAKVIAVDIDEQEYKKKMIEIDHVFLCDVKEFLHSLHNCMLKKAKSDWIGMCWHWKEIFPKCEEKYKSAERVDLHFLAEELSAQMADNGIVVTDAGYEELILPAVIAFKNKQRLIHPASQGVMGFSLPAAVGAVLSEDRQVISVNGDGSVMMNLQELQTISYYQLPVKIILVNNNCYAVIRKRQQDLFRSRTIGTDRSNGVCCPDFEKVAQAFDIPYRRIETSKELKVGLSDFLREAGPGICEVLAVEEQEYLHTSFTRGANGRIVRRPLEDLSPFMERDLFLSEMVIEPIDQ